MIKEISLPIYRSYISGNRNGKPTKFNYEETLQLKDALCDLDERIRRAADKI